MNWPIGCGKDFQGVYDREKSQLLFFSGVNGRAKAEKSGLKVSIVPQSATRGRGGGVSFRKDSKNGSIPKLVNAEPKNTGESLP